MNYITKGKLLFSAAKPEIFDHQIAFNIFPQIGGFNDDGTTEEEAKIAEELQKILGEHFSASVTCVRVPVFISHSMSVNIEFEKDINASEAEEILSEADGIMVNGSSSEHPYTTPIEAVENDAVYISRIRDDASQKNTLNMWICCDNLRKGAALNAVQIAEDITK